MFKKLFKAFFFWFVRRTKRYVWVMAEAYDLNVQRAGFPHGRHPVEIEDRDEALRQRIPKSVYFNTASGKISVGRRVVFGEHVRLLTGMHMNIADAQTNKVELHHVPEFGRDIVIEDGAYIGSGATVIGPVTIHAYSTVAAGAVVTKDVPARTMVAGVPARVVRTY